MKSSNEPIKSPKDPDQKPTFAQKIIKMDSLLSMVVLGFCGSAILIAPASAYITLDKSNIPDLSSKDLAYLQAPVTNIVRWSFFLTSIWIVWLILYFFFLYAPFLLSRWVLLNYGYVSVRAERILDYIPQVFYQLTWCAWFIMTSIIYCIIFAQFQIMDTWLTILQTILVFMVFSMCLLGQRIIVQKIALDFNRVAYNDRLQKSKRDMKLIDKLRKSVKRGGVFDFLDVDQILSSSGGGSYSVRGTSPVRTSLEHPGPNYSSIGDINQKKRSTPNIVHFFKSSSPVSISENQAITQHVSSGGKSPISSPHLSLDDKAQPPYPHVSSEDQPKLFNRSPKKLKKIDRPASSDSNIQKSLTSPSPKNIDIESQEVIVLLSENGFPDQTNPQSDHASEDSPKRTLDRLDTSSYDKTTVLDKVMVGGIKKMDRIFDLSGDHEAQKLAQRVWSALKQKSMQELTINNFYSLFPMEEEAKEMFDFLDVDKNGRLSFEEIKGTMQMIYKEKRDLHSSLNDLSHALGHLNFTLYACSVFITFLIALPIYGISLNAILPFTSFFLALSFIFGGAMRTAFDCIVFIFIRHPYDSGDRVIIGDKSYVVLEVSLLETVLRSDGKICYYPNGDLSQKSIINIRRSGDLSDYVVIGVSCTVTEAKMRQLNSTMLNFCQSQKTRLKPACSMVVLDIGPVVKYQFSIEYKGNWQDSPQRWITKSMFLFELKRAMQEMQIELMNFEKN